eukprot:3119234-Pleurochrysis_carterae.AAC.1
MARFCILNTRMRSSVRSRVSQQVDLFSRILRSNFRFRFSVKPAISELGCSQAAALQADRLSRAEARASALEAQLEDVQAKLRSANQVRNFPRSWRSHVEGFRERKVVFARMSLKIS